MKRLILAAIPLYSDMVGLYCLFLLLTNFTDTGMQRFPFFPYLALGLVALGVNLLFGRKERSLRAVAILNILMLAAVETGMFLLSPGISQLGVKVSAFVIFAWPVARGMFLARKSPPAATMLTYSELSIMGAGAFFLAQLAEFSPGAAANVLCLITIGLNLAALSHLRGLGAVQAQGQRASRRSRAAVLLVAALLMIGATLLLGLLLLPGTTGAIVAAAVAVKDGVLWFLATLWQGIEYLISLLPGSDIAAEAPPLTPVASNSGGEEGYGPAEIPEWMPYLLIGVIAAVVVVIVVVVLVRLGKNRLRLRAAAADAGEEKSLSPSLWGLLAAALRRLWGRVRFYRLLLARWHTAAGLMVRLELRGKRCGCPRAPGQTPREFLLVLSARAEDAEAKDGFEALAAGIDRLCFASGPPAQRLALPAGQVRAMLRATRPRQAQRGRRAAEPQFQAR